MLRQSMLTLLFLCSFLITVSALAKTATVKGTLSREFCEDDGDAFSLGDCRELPIGSDRTCIVQQQTDRNGYLTSVRISSPAFVATGDFRNQIIKVRLSDPYMIGPGGVAYFAKVNRKTSAEFMTDLDNRLITKANIYTHHVLKENGRTYIQYSCRFN